MRYWSSSPTPARIIKWGSTYPCIDVYLGPDRKKSLRTIKKSHEIRTRLIRCVFCSSSTLCREAWEQNRETRFEHIAALRGQGRPSPKADLAKSWHASWLDNHQLPLHDQRGQHDRRYRKHFRIGRHHSRGQRTIHLHSAKRLRPRRNDDASLYSG